MDHRCLYGHRVPAAFTFAIQSRSCPTCGAATVTVNGYQAARKLTTEAGLDAVAAFGAIRVLESEWVLTPAAAAAATAPTATPGAALAEAVTAEAAPPTEEEEVVVEDEPMAASVVVAPPEPRITPRARPVEKRPEPAPETPSVAPTEPPPGIRVSSPGFGADEEDFFKGA
ncbi:MAG: hypothetical protein ACK4YP_03240 [Myxococcota bacterium]